MANTPEKMVNLLIGEYNPHHDCDLINVKSSSDNNRQRSQSDQRYTGIHDQVRLRRRDARDYTLAVGSVGEGRVMKAILLFGLSLLLTACQSAGVIYSRDSGAYQAIELELNQSLTIAPERTRVFIQDGRVFANVATTDHYRPQCALEVEHRRPNAQSIAAGRFIIARVQGLIDSVVQSRELQLAGLIVTGMVDDGAPMVHTGYHFWFKPNTAQLRRMSCYGVFAEMQNAEAPTVEDIRVALNGVAQLSLQASVR